MDEARIILSASWVALMPTYLLGDVLRIFAGDFTVGEMDGVESTQLTWPGAGLVMQIPIAIVVLSLIVPHPAIRWANIVVAALLVLFNLAGLPYPGPVRQRAHRGRLRQLLRLELSRLTRRRGPAGQRTP